MITDVYENRDSMHQTGEEKRRKNIVVIAVYCIIIYRKQLQIKQLCNCCVHDQLTFMSTQIHIDMQQLKTNKIPYSPIINEIQRRY